MYREINVHDSDLKIQGACAYGECPVSGYFIDQKPSRVPGNLATGACKTPGGFQCSDTEFVGATVSHTGCVDRRERVLNGSGGLSASREFCEAPESACGARGYTSDDPRLLSLIRGQRLVLDKAPLESNPESCRNQRYSTYSDINNGQIVYYLTDTDVQPYITPNYIMKSKVVHDVFIDAMGGVRPNYYRYPIDECEQLERLAPDQYSRDALSWREDLMARQSMKQNQMSWGKRWGWENE